MVLYAILFWQVLGKRRALLGGEVGSDLVVSPLEGGCSSEMDREEQEVSVERLCCSEYLL